MVCSVRIIFNEVATRVPECHAAEDLAARLEGWSVRGLQYDEEIMDTASEDEVAELLGDRAVQTIVERIANLGVTLDEVSEALDDVDYQTRFGEVRVAATPRIGEIRTILEELPFFEDLLPETGDEESEHEGLTVREPDELEADL